jgi:hypothetical protein
MPAVRKHLYRWIRQLHLHAGLFVSPFVLLYALTAIFAAYGALPWGGAEAGAVERSTVRVSLKADSNSLVMAERVRDQLGFDGEIGYTNRNEDHLFFPLESPGHRAQVRVDLRTGLAEVERRETGVWDAMLWLHKMPGPHNAKIRGNWVFTRAWRWLADLSVYLLLFLTASGVYLWLVLRAERRAGLIFLGGGALSFVLLVSVLIG